MTILAIDPGCSKSAAIKIEVLPNIKIPKFISYTYLINTEFVEWLWDEEADLVIIESLASNGGASQEVVDTAYWVGRFWTMSYVSGKPTAGALRRSVCKMILGTIHGSDKKVTEYCYTYYGCKTPQEARGNKKKPGILPGVSTHGWQALGLALATVEALRRNKTDEFYWDPMYTSSEEFKQKREDRRKKKKQKQQRAALKGSNKEFFKDLKNNLEEKIKPARRKGSGL